MRAELSDKCGDMVSLSAWPNRFAFNFASCRRATIYSRHLFLFRKATCRSVSAQFSWHWQPTAKPPPHEMNLHCCTSLQRVVNTELVIFSFSFLELLQAVVEVGEMTDDQARDDVLSVLKQM